MKKPWVVAAFLWVASILPGVCSAEVIFRTGAGVIFEDRKPGVGASIGYRVPRKSVAVEAFIDYFSKSGDSQIPAGIRFLYVSSGAKQKTMGYMGVGGGVGYSKFNPEPFTSMSKTLGLLSAVFGFQVRTAPRAGLFLEATMNRLLTANATTDLAGRVGLFVRIGGG